ncbi:hypothetical protein ACMD2_17468 [Ananas comosus]|uniref:Uncharacterized protein n=1 Tax=Ananas comosus TaxID=4615 RepID=A0A199VXC4_ANACO|nr:hypothetical protein ACMD2_17468 [Ananas comosus]
MADYEERVSKINHQHAATISTFSVIIEVNHSGAKYPGVPLIREDVLRLDVEMSNFLPAIFVEIR